MALLKNVLTKTEETEKNAEKGSVQTAEKALPTGNPAVDIYADDNAWYVEAALPGVDGKDTEVSVEDGVLIIRGETSVEVPENAKLRYSEFRRRNFERRFTLDDKIDTENIEAAAKNGILRVKLPKKQAEAKKINVKVD